MNLHYAPYPGTEKSLIQAQNSEMNAARQYNSLKFHNNRRILGEKIQKREKVKTVHMFFHQLT